MVFKPESKVVVVEHSVPQESDSAHFKIHEGMFVTGKTIPAVANAKVTINRDNKISLKDREPHVVMTDE